MVEQHMSDSSADILLQPASVVKWVPYNKFHVRSYHYVHHSEISNVVNLKVKSQEIAFTARMQLSTWLSVYPSVSICCRRE